MSKTVIMYSNNKLFLKSMTRGDGQRNGVLSKWQDKKTSHGNNLGNKNDLSSVKIFCLIRT